MTVLLASLVDAMVVLALGLTAAALLRRRSAALRHATVASAIVAAFAMPALELLLPQLPVIRWGTPVAVVSTEATLTSTAAISGSAGDDAGVEDAAIPWGTLFVVVWAAGAIVTGGGLAAGLIRLARLESRCVPADGRWRELTDEISRQCGLRRQVAVLESDEPSLLVATGVLNPTIVLPAGASAWHRDRMQIVLRHELAHVRRHDAVIQLAGELLRVVQWMNPLVWIACRRLRQESEYACDDAVLGGGVDATDYATHLLDVARHLSGRPPAWISAPAIAHASTLERRIVAMLHRDRNRAPLSRRGLFIAALAALVVGIPLAAAGVAPVDHVAVDRPATGDVALRTETPDSPTRIEARAPEAPNEISSSRRPRPAAPTGAAAVVRQAAIAGRVLDPSGGVLPGAQITLTDTQIGVQLTAVADAAGRFAFRDLQPGQYEIAVSLSGFATSRDALTLASGQALQRTIMLQLGTLQERITLVCSAPAVARDGLATSAGQGHTSLAAGLRSLAARLQRVARAVDDSLFPVLAAQEPAVIRVGGNIRAPKKIKDVKPVCPAVVPAGETTVKLTGRVGVDGFIIDMTPTPTDTGIVPPAEFVDAALDAVRQWVFTPALLNRQPVEVSITVDIVFRRS